MKLYTSHILKLILLLSVVFSLAVVFFVVYRTSPLQQLKIHQHAKPNNTIQPHQLQSQTLDPYSDRVIKPSTSIVKTPQHQQPLSFQDHLAMQAELRLQSNVTYDSSYRKIAYPMGDVPENIGVCTDVVVRSFRGLGVDLQQRVHEDMKRNFKRYPTKWGLSKPDSNIDHRRVPNLMTYFDRAGASLKITNDPLDYFAGNVVAWDLGKGLVHIGIVSNYVSERSNNPLVIHNIGAGPQMNDMLFDYEIIGHYKYGTLD